MTTGTSGSLSSGGEASTPAASGDLGGELRSPPQSADLEMAARGPAPSGDLGDEKEEADEEEEAAKSPAAKAWEKRDLETGRVPPPTAEDDAGSVGSLAGPFKAPAKKHGGACAAACAAAAAWCGDLCGGENPQDGYTERHLRVNDGEWNDEQKFASNFVSTTQYTLLTFLPKNLYQQLGKAANFYFFVLAIIVSIPGVSPIAAWTNITPLVFVLSVTAAREAIEDYGRYKDDKEVNSRQVSVLRGGELVSVQWQEVVVGDIVKVYEGEFFPADCVCLSSSIATGECSIETSNLDGETALKQRQSLRQTVALRTVEELSALSARVECELPNPNLHFFEGVWVSADGERSPVGHDELLLRGTALMNTEFIYGLAIFTGHQSKLHLNLNEPVHKRTRVEHITNQQMYKIFGLLFVICVVFAIIFGLSRDRQAEDLWYLDLPLESSFGDKVVNGIRDWAAFLILYSLMVPISLYVSMELVRVAQSVWIWLDIGMYDPKSHTRAKARAAALNEQLGEIEYIFCDKTGTLTENQMAFAKCSVNGVPYGAGVEDLPGAALRPKPTEQSRRSSLALADGRQSINERRGSFMRLPTGMRRQNNMLFPEFKLDDVAMFQAVEDGDSDVVEYLTCLALCHTVNIVREDQELTRLRSVVAEKELADEAAERTTPRRSGSTRGSRKGRKKRPTAAEAVRPPGQEASAGAEAARSGTATPAGAHSRAPSGVSLASPRSSVAAGRLSGPVPSEAEEEMRRLSTRQRRRRSNSLVAADFSMAQVAYQASSPDEMALVVAARALGVFYFQKERDSLLLDTPQGPQRYELLHVVGFTSDRKRMSVVVRDPKGGVHLYIKGADSVILDLLSRDPVKNPPPSIKRSKEHLEQFSREGLRVMCVATRSIAAEEYEAWARRYDEASRSMGNRKEEMERVGGELERDLRLLGTTAIEDKLQEGVPDTIAKLRNAGIKVWILTGDKQETAVNIGKSCNLLDNLDLQFVATGEGFAEHAGVPRRDSTFQMSVPTKSMARSIKATLKDLRQETQAVISRSRSAPGGGGGGDIPEEGDEEGGGGEAEEKRGGGRGREARAGTSGAPRASFLGFRNWLGSSRNGSKPPSAADGSVGVPSETGDTASGGAGPPPLQRQLTQKEVYAIKVAEAADELPRRKAEINDNLVRIRERLDERAALDAARSRRLAKMSAKERAAEVARELPEEAVARMGAALVIDGPTLQFALHRTNVDEFTRIISHPQCRVVVCARLAPRQKSAIVALVKERIGAITLSIGDGANDVSMIQEAHVGVGISGQEGMQAVNASDFSIAQFRFLAKLVLVHGRWSYTRNTLLVLYSFYKNFTISWVQLWFTTHTGFSDQEVFDGVLLNSFNLFWTSLPILFMAVFDQDLGADDLLQFPEVYKDREAFTVARFWGWTLLGVAHSAVVFFLPFYALPAGGEPSFWSASISVYTVLVHVVTAKLAVMHNSINGLNVFVICLSLLAWWGFAFLYTDLPTFAPTAFGTMNHATQVPGFFFALVLALFLAVAPDLVYRYYQRQWMPTGRMIIQERRNLGMGMPERPTAEEIARGSGGGGDGNGDGVGRSVSANKLAPSGSADSSSSGVARRRAAAATADTENSPNTPRVSGSEEDIKVAEV